MKQSLTFTAAVVTHVSASWALQLFALFRINYFSGIAHSTLKLKDQNVFPAASQQKFIKIDQLKKKSNFKAEHVKCQLLFIFCLELWETRPFSPFSDQIIKQLIKS